MDVEGVGHGPLQDRGRLEVQGDGRVASANRGKDSPVPKKELRLGG